MRLREAVDILYRIGHEKVVQTFVLGPFEISENIAVEVDAHGLIKIRHRRDQAITRCFALNGDLSFYAVGGFWGFNKEVRRDGDPVNTFLDQELCEVREIGRSLAADAYLDVFLIGSKDEHAEEALDGFVALVVEMRYQRGVAVEPEGELGEEEEEIKWVISRGRVL